MEEWASLRDSVLGELHRHDAFEPSAELDCEDTPICFDCGNGISPDESYRCTDCVVQPYFCQACMVSAHACEPFHRIQVSFISYCPCSTYSVLDTKHFSKGLVRKVLEAGITI